MLWNSGNVCVMFSNAWDAHFSDLTQVLLKVTKTMPASFPYAPKQGHTCSRNIWKVGYFGVSSQRSTRTNEAQAPCRGGQFGMSIKRSCSLQFSRQAAISNLTISAARRRTQWVRATGSVSVSKTAGAGSRGSSCSAYLTPQKHSGFYSPPVCVCVCLCLYLSIY